MDGRHGLGVGSGKKIEKEELRFWFTSAPSRSSFRSPWLSRQGATSNYLPGSQAFSMASNPSILSSWCHSVG